MKPMYVTQQILKRKAYFRYLLLLWFSSVSIFLWLVNINLLAYILVSPVLSVADKLDIIFNVYISFFTINDLFTLSRVVLSLLVAVNFTLMVFLWKAGRQRSVVVKNNSGALVAMIGSHCVACGTSLLAPLVTALAGSGTYLSSERFAATQLLATGVNILAIVLVIWSAEGIARRIALSGLLAPQDGLKSPN